jgi:hypothetical protein
VTKRSGAQKVAFCMTPYHLLEALSFHDAASPMTVLAQHGDRYAPLLAEVAGLRVYSVESRREFLRTLIDSRERFDFYFATIWNRSALLYEKAALRSGGHINIFDDGAGCFGPIGKDWRRPVRKLAYALLDSTQYCDHPSEKRFDRSRTTFHSVRPDLAPFPSKQIDLPSLRNLLTRLREHFEHLAPYCGLPVFFDTNDCDNDWYPFDRKVEILRSLLPNEPTIYLPHPGQRLSIVRHLPQLIDLSDKVHRWNELACYFLQPKKVYSAFSTCAFTLHYVFGMSFENHFMHEEFYRRTGHRNFLIPPNMRVYFAGI